MWAAVDLAEMGPFPSFNCGVKYLCVIDVFTKYAWVYPLTETKAKTVLNGFIGIVNGSKCKPNKSWVDHERKFYNNLTQKWLNDVLMYSTCNEIKPLVAGRFIRILKGKIYEKWQHIIVVLILTI